MRRGLFALFCEPTNIMTCSQHLAQFTAVIFHKDNSRRHGTISPHTLFVVISITSSQVRPGANIRTIQEKLCTWVADDRNWLLCHQIIW